MVSDGNFIRKGASVACGVTGNIRTVVKIHEEGSQPCIVPTIVLLFLDTDKTKKYD